MLACKKVQLVLSLFFPSSCRRGGKYTVRQAAEIKQRRKRNSKAQQPMRDEVFNLQTSLPTSPTPPPGCELGSRHNSTVIEANDRGSLGVQENGANGSIPNQSGPSSPRSVSPLPLPPPHPDIDSPYSIVSVHPNYTMVTLNNQSQSLPFSNHVVDSFSDQLPLPPPSSFSNIGYTDQVHDIISGTDFQKIDMSGVPSFETEEFDRLEGFAPPVHTMPRFDIITTRGEEGSSCDTSTLTRDGLGSRDYSYSPATTSSLINHTPEPQADHRVTFAPAVITISPEPFLHEEFTGSALVHLNSSNCNNNLEGIGVDLTDRADNTFSDSNLPPVAQIVEGEELSEQLEPSSTITI